MSIYDDDGVMTSESCPSGHAWVGGMMRLSEEDVEAAAKVRHVECERCELPYPGTPPAVDW